MIQNKVKTSDYIKREELIEFQWKLKKLDNEEKILKLSEEIKKHWFNCPIAIWDKRWDMNSNNFADWEIAWTSFDSPMRIYKQIWSWMIKEWESWSRLHPTQKPVKLAEWTIDNYMNKDEKNIIDFFWWSWFTLIWAENKWKKSFTMEFEPHYVQVMLLRYFKYIWWNKPIKCLNRNINLDLIFNK